MDDVDFSAIVREHGPVVYRVIYRLVGSRQEAEDLVQETFIRAYRHLPKYRGEASLRTWLCRIATNVAITWLQSRQQWEHPTDPERLSRVEFAGTALGGLAQGDGSEEVCLRRDVAVALARLSPALRVTLALRIYADLSYTEIAEALNCPIGTVMSRLNAARKVLRGSLSGWLKEGRESDEP